MQLSLKSFLILAFATGFISSGAAQEKESLLIGPGDLVKIHVFDTPELDQAVRVTDAGTVPLTLGGDIKIASETPSGAALAIEQALVKGRFMLHPHVSVTVTEFATGKVSVLGDVRMPGEYPINTPRSVVDVLALAGGLTELADRKIVIERRGSQEKIPYFLANGADAVFDRAVLINPGDTIFVPKAGLVYVMGDVARPGGYTMTNNDAQITVLELIARAGGTNHSSVPSKARLIRRKSNANVESPLPLSEMQSGRKPDLNLEAGDVIYVPFSYLRNFGMQASGVAASVGSAAVYRF